MAKTLNIGDDECHFISHPKFELFKSVVNGLIAHQGYNFYPKDAIDMTEAAWEAWTKHCDSNPL